MKVNKFAALLAGFIFTALHADGNCPHDWFSFGTKCIKITERSLIDFVIAQLVCQISGGRLVSISSVEMLEFLSIHTNSYRISNFWVGIEPAGDGQYRWFDGMMIERELPWVQQNSSIPGSCFMYNGAKVEQVQCSEKHGAICARSKTLYDAKENCLVGRTEHSFVGEVSGYCVYRTPGAATRDNVNAECSKAGGKFLDLDEILIDGVTAFVEHKVMVNDNFKYWTGLTVNGTALIKPSGEPYYSIMHFQQGSGTCVTVSFNVEDVLKTQLYQTECRDHAYAICAAPSSNLTTNSSSTPVKKQLKSCPPGKQWKEDPATDSCFWETSFETSRSWSDARKYCQAFGGDLASFHDENERKIGLSFQFGTEKKLYWIGLYLDLETETYKWSDGSPVDYEVWAPGHPDHKDKRLRCVAVDSSGGRWVSRLCGIESWFVCKAPKSVDPPTPVIPLPEPLVPCNKTEELPQWFHYQGYCYQVLNFLRSWHGANDYCETANASLVSIHSDDEIGFLLKMLANKKGLPGNRVWIGLNSLRSGVFRWTDETPFDLTYWNKNEPNNMYNQEKCANMYIGNGFWNDENCHSAMGFICKQNEDANVTVEVPTTRDPRIGNCKKGWLAEHDRCYLPLGFKDKEKLNWKEASQNCYNLGGYLVSIRNAEEQAYLTYLMQELKNDVWIGFHDTLQSGRYYWLDNSDTQYTNWAPGEPSLFGNKEDCVKMAYHELDSGMWRSSKCTKRLPYICQTEKDPDLPKPEHNIGLSCINPEGWLKLDDMCFKMFAGNLLTWKEAENACERQGGNLVSLSGSSVRAVSTYLGMEVDQAYWIGLKYEESTQKFRWLNGWPMAISKWGNNEPSGQTDVETCFASTQEGYWKSVPCSARLSFICQITTSILQIPTVHTAGCPETSELWIPTDGNLCYIYERDPGDWISINTKCHKYGGFLISIHSMEEIEQIRKTVKSDIKQIFIGLVRNDQEGFSWTDQTAVDFINWEEDQPEKNIYNCVAMMVDTLKWKVVPCESRIQALCAIKKGVSRGHFEKEKHSVDSSTGLSNGAVVGIVICSIVLLVLIIIFAFFLRSALGRRWFWKRSVSWENALYNVHEANVEFQDEHTGFRR